MLLKTLRYKAVICALAIGVPVANCLAVDNASQMTSKFRVNYAGYLPQAKKLGLYVSNNVGAINWSLSGTTCSGSASTYVTNDKSSGDSFYQIDFSSCTTPATNVRLVVGADQSPPFDIANDPYGAIKFEFFDYFKDHEATATFNQTKNTWQSGLSLSFAYVKDAGDNGAYPVNTAEASWALINALETYPAINTYYSTGMSGARTVYQQLTILTEQFNHVLSHAGKLAIPKFHTNVNSSWAACAPYTSGTCISEPETKATFSTARALAAMARVHSVYGTSATANSAYQKAKTALNNARTQPFECNQSDAFGGEGGMYPDNDVYSIYRNPKSLRDNCFTDINNTQDDEYAALVENYLAALKLGITADASSLASLITSSPRFNEASSFWWGAVTMEANLSLLTNQSLHTLNLTILKNNILIKALAIRTNQALGYPGVTWDPNSNAWDNGDQDSVDNNVRWGSHRMALNDARILMAASDIQKANNLNASAAAYARSAIQVLDHMSGINAMNLTMYTASGYTSKFENAVERTHDAADGGNAWPGKLVLGPNNWTNAEDPDMPAFNSKPGLKMFAPTGTGWSSREVSIDANAALIPVAYFTTEVAPALLALDPIGGVSSSSSSVVSSSSISSVSSSISSSVVASSSSVANTANLIANGNYSNGTTSWTCSVNTGTATCTVVNGQFFINISNGGTETWHIQPKQENLTLTSGKTYTFAFDARATANRSAQIKIERAVSPYEDFSNTGAGQNLTTSLQRFKYTFNMNTSLTNARLVMNVGNNVEDIYIDNIYLVEGSADPCNGLVGCSASSSSVAQSSSSSVVQSSSLSSSIASSSIVPSSSSVASSSIVPSSSSVASSVASSSSSAAATKTIQVRMRGVAGTESVNVSVGGTTVQTWTLTTAMANYSTTTNLNGEIRVNYTNDATGRDVQVDYLIINNVTKQAEQQTTNTGAWGNNRCGGAGASEWLHCSGYISFGNTP